MQVCFIFTIFARLNTFAILGFTMMMPHPPFYTFSSIAQVLQARICCVAQPRARINYLATDTRRITTPVDETLFVALVGDKYNAHDFVLAAYNEGIRKFVVSQAVAYQQMPAADVMMVAHTTQALQQLAAYHRASFVGLPVVGITGSNGKTVVKEWLYQLLQGQYDVVRSPQSYNSQVGVPLSVWQLSARHQLALFEAGISQPNEMPHLQAIIQPTIGIFTNIGTAHSQAFDTQARKVLEKMHLFERVQTLIYRADYALIRQTISQLQHSHAGTAKYAFDSLAWSSDPLTAQQCACQYVQIDKHAHHTRLSLDDARGQHQLQLPFTDDASIENGIHAWLLCRYLGVSHTHIARQMRQLQAVAMRLELKAGINHCLLINDTYNADLQSLAVALHFLEQQQQLSRKTIILSDILESGQSDHQLYHTIGELLHRHHISRLIGIGKKMSAHRHVLNHINSTFFDTTRDFLAADLAFEQEVILLKGARSFAFEDITQVLAQKIHTTTLEINLNAIVHNLHTYRQLLLPTTKIMVMVKAFGYGSGGAEIAHTLQYHQADYLAVAYPDEGVALRKGGVKLPIMVMNPPADSFATLCKYRLEPEIYALSHLKKWEQFLQYHIASHQHTRLLVPPIHLKIDTGMHRLGFDWDNLAELLHTLAQAQQVQVASIFSHLAAADSPQHDHFTHQQISRFEHAYQQIKTVLPYHVMRHLLNTAGIVRFGASAQYDMVRLGLGCYGIDSTDTLQTQLQHTGTLTTYISQIKNLSPPETVGYNRQGIIAQASRIATVGIGYADGLPRRLGNGQASMWVGGKLAPIVGNVCMDMTMLDISHLPDVQEGDPAIVFGSKLPVQQLAQWANTIPYEILTGIAARVRRVYFSE